MWEAGGLREVVQRSRIRRQRLRLFREFGFVHKRSDCRCDRATPIAVLWHNGYAIIERVEFGFLTVAMRYGIHRFHLVAIQQASQILTR